jgi:hypothetical protein
MANPTGQKHRSVVGLLRRLDTDPEHLTQSRRRSFAPHPHNLDTQIEPAGHRCSPVVTVMKPVVK